MIENGIKKDQDSSEVQVTITVPGRVKDNLPGDFDINDIGKINLRDAENIASENILFLNEQELIDGLEDFELIPLRDEESASHEEDEVSVDAPIADETDTVNIPETETARESAAPQTVEGPRSEGPEAAAVSPDTNETDRTTETGPVEPAEPKEGPHKALTDSLPVDEMNWAPLEKVNTDEDGSRKWIPLEELEHEGERDNLSEGASPRSDDREEIPQISENIPAEFQDRTGPVETGDAPAPEAVEETPEHDEGEKEEVVEAGAPQAPEDKISPAEDTAPSRMEDDSDVLWFSFDDDARNKGPVAAKESEKDKSREERTSPVEPKRTASSPPVAPVHPDPEKAHTDETDTSEAPAPVIAAESKPEAESLKGVKAREGDDEAKGLEKKEVPETVHAAETGVEAGPVSEVKPDDTKEVEVPADSMAVHAGDDEVPAEKKLREGAPRGEVAPAGEESPPGPSVLGQPSDSPGQSYVKKEASISEMRQATAEGQVVFINDESVSNAEEENALLFDRDDLNRLLSDIVVVHEGKSHVLSEADSSEDRAMIEILDETPDQDYEDIFFESEDSRRYLDSELEYVHNAIIEEDYADYIRDIDAFYGFQGEKSVSTATEILGLTIDEFDSIDDILFGDEYRDVNFDAIFDLFGRDGTRGPIEKNCLYLISSPKSLTDEERQSIEEDISTEYALIFEESVDDIRSKLKSLGKNEKIDSVEVVDTVYNITDKVVILDDEEDVDRFISDLPEEKQVDMKTLLSFLDGLFEKLPEEVIKKFASSDYFNLYLKVLNELEV